MKLSYSVLLFFLVVLVCNARIIRHARSLSQIVDYETNARRIAPINAEHFLEKWLREPTSISDDELLKQLTFFMDGLKNRIDSSATDEYWLLRQG